jgi:hypothetical protein
MVNGEGSEEASVNEDATSVRLMMAALPLKMKRMSASHSQ